MSLAAAFALASHAEETYELNPLVVNANRIESSDSKIQPPVSSLSLQEIDSDKFRDISDALSSYPGIASYRRTHPTSAHPATQGTRIRNSGANATSRALVLYNGVPQNDPFGAWVYWHQFDLSKIEAISIHPSGSGELWGNMASGGLVSVIAKDSLPGSAQAQASIGSSNRYDLRASSAHSLGEDVVFDIGIRHFSTDGFYTLREDQRGSVDEPANSEATSLNAQLSWGTSVTWKSQFVARGFEEKRSNGTAVAQNDTQAYDLSFITERQLADSDARLNINLYFQDRDFRNVFSSVADDRNSERPALDQYDVPAQSFGGAIVYRQDSDLPLSYSAGLDFRAIDGSINERYRNLGAGFTRDRYAGGKQQFIGLFGSVSSELDESNRLTATARIDQVDQTDGSRIETDTTTNTVIRNDSYADRENTILTGNLTWRHQFSDTTASHLSIFSGFRAPTLNELYRPFRVRNDITEAKPDLLNERQQGLDYTLSIQSDDHSSLRLSAFHYETDEMVANALLTTESGFDPRFGFIPSGGSGSIRANLDKTTVSGIELHAMRQLGESLKASLAAVYADTEITADELSQFVGNAFPQSPPWRVIAGLDWQASEAINFWSRYSWTDRSFENLTNTTRLGASGGLSIGGSYQIDESSSISFTLTNALDEENVTGIATNGLVTMDEPREFLVTYTWRR
ncbi:TonB-dependent receptor domain protein [Verrucomicrobiia bacterium DG1235]|nr:TonB-dependent receptor domain protein [Verrucomicrobiae bacterium DG1235]